MQYLLRKVSPATAAAVFITFTILNAAPASASIRLPQGAPQCVRWGAENVENALAAKHIPEAQARVSVTYGAARLPADEAFSLEKKGAAIAVRGGGPVGAMYGLLELAERIEESAGSGRWAGIAAGIQPAHQRPYLAIRADNVFIHVHPFLLDDMAMWRQYIDMLARDRFNMLDLHGGFDVNITNFPNLFPFLVTVPGYPQVGNREAQAKNLAALKAIVAYAKTRGIKVALMDYSSAVYRPRPPGQSHMFGQPGKSSAARRRRFVRPVPLLKGAQVADYTSKAVTELVRQVPDLYEIGFRIGETGQNAGFFRETYLKGLADAGPAANHIRLYTRSWLTTKAQLEHIAGAYKSGFDIEIKYNGEQLGLPYHALQGRFGSYSYQQYLDVAANYGVIWQVRANGTHHYWSWENTDFIRRTVHTLRLGHARGFTLEPMIAYYPVDAAVYYRSQADKSVYKYIWQKHWMWYLAWGRLAYNPSLPSATLVRAFADHFGAAGRTIYNAMQASSAVVPLVCAYRFVGADQRDYSPETETGYLDNRFSIIGNRSPVPEGLLQYARNTPEDSRSFVGINQWENERIDDMPDGRLGPFAVAELLQNAAETAQNDIAQVPPLEGRAAAEWRLLKTDLLAAALLGRYHAARIQGLAYFLNAWHTNNAAEYAKATQLLAQSRQAWQTLAETADAAYAPLNNPVRWQWQFEWKSQLPVLDKIDSQAADLWAKRPRGGARMPDGSRAGPIHLLATDHPGNDGLKAGHLGYVIAPSRKSVRLACDASATSGLADVILWWKPLPSGTYWRSQTMVETSRGAYATRVPLTSEGLMYMVELEDKKGEARNFPQEVKETPYRVIPPLAP